MTKLINIIIIIFFISGCSSDKFMYIECQKFSTMDLLPQIKKLLLNENMDIVTFDSSDGYIKAHLNQKIYSLKGGSCDNYWEITVEDYEIKARAWIIMNIPSEDFNAEIAPMDIKSINSVKRQYLIDINNLDYSWYSNVKSGIEYLCGNKLDYK